MILADTSLAEFEEFERIADDDLDSLVNQNNFDDLLKEVDNAAAMAERIRYREPVTSVDEYEEFGSNYGPGLKFKKL